MRVESAAPVIKNTAVGDNFEEISDFNEKGLFVGGCPKSGTTLLLTLLDSHPQLVVYPRETHYLDEHRKYKALRGFPARLRHLLERSEMRSVGASNDKEREARSTETLKNSRFNYEHFARLAGEFIHEPWMNDSLLLSETVRAYAAAMGHDWQECVRWVEKTPSNVPYSHDLFRLFPKAKLIQIVRDPRAVFASRRRLLLNRYGTYAKAHRLVREWNESSRQIPHLQKKAGNYLLIRYEDLLRDTRAVMEQVCEFAGIEFSPVLLEPTTVGKKWLGNSAYDNNFSGIESNQIDQWKKELTEDEIWWIEMHCREGMKIAGYEPQSDARFCLPRWAKRLAGESLGGYLRARKSSLCQLMGALKDCRYDTPAKASSHSAA